jgi:hypothetical protein
MGVRHDYYWRGIASGRVLAQDPERDYEGELKLQLALVESPTNPHRAFAMGELRGYRLEKDERILRPAGHVTVEQWKRERVRQIEKMRDEVMDEPVGAVTPDDPIPPGALQNIAYVEDAARRAEQSEAMRASNAGAWEER